MPNCSSPRRNSSIIQRLCNSSETQVFSLAFSTQRAHEFNYFLFTSLFPKSFPPFAFPRLFFFRFTRPSEFAHQPRFFQFAENALNLNQSFPHRVFAH